MHLESADFDFARPDATVVIAEVGVNHNGDPALARRMVDVARAAGADIVKFQAFKSEKEISRYAPKAQYQQQNTGADGGQLELCKALELDGATLASLKAYCAQVSMPFLCTAFDFDSADLLFDDLKVSAIKIGSAEVTNLPFLEYIGARKVGAVLSTGASNLAEVGAAVKALTAAGCPELVLLHCVSSYPAPVAEANLRAMATLKREFGLPVGFSDHTPGIDAAIAAAALGACAVEKHFTTDRNLPGPDHLASVEPYELKSLVEGVRAANCALGSGLKVPAPCELPNLPLIRKSLVAARDLPAGAELTRDMIEIKRPLGGIEPGDLRRVLGRRLKAAVKEDMPITWNDVT
ncbi:MAG TPA: N-acetylneuraminate synthase family protein [Burkholderiales bacterium]|jgi:N-acetylneuraminate synthase|nr:N-acetylneuraminate synthase family protein [Burkholderiales bacterium]